MSVLNYPQLTNGSVCQFPVARSGSTRTIVNGLSGGEVIRMSDPSAGTIRWRLRYSNLTVAEWDSIKQLFEAAEGRLNTFTFLDPTDNLLTWSEDWTKPVWRADPLLVLGAGVSDPLGRNNALRVTNAAQAAGRITQTIECGAWFQYCFSLFLRSDAAQLVQLLQASTSQERRTAVHSDSNWRRLSLAGSLSSNQGQVSFGLELPAGAQIEAFGAQVEGQPSPGPYKKNTNRSGVSNNTRFDMDSLIVTSDGPNRYSCAVHLVSFMES